MLEGHRHPFSARLRLKEQPLLPLVSLQKFHAGSKSEVPFRHCTGLGNHRVHEAMPVRRTGLLRDARRGGIAGIAERIVRCPGGFGEGIRMIQCRNWSLENACVAEASQKRLCRRTSELPATRFLFRQAARSADPPALTVGLRQGFSRTPVICCGSSRTLCHP